MKKKLMAIALVTIIAVMAIAGSSAADIPMPIASTESSAITIESNIILFFI